MQLFNVSEASRLSGMLPQTLRNMVTAGLLVPAQPGTTGTGQGHKFSLIQVIALAAHVRYRSQGAAADRAMGVMKLIEAPGLEKLEMHLDKGETFPVPAMMLGDVPQAACWQLGMMVKPPADLSGGAANLLRQLDLKVLKKKVEQDIAKPSRPAKKPGRSRQLVLVSK